MGRYVLKRFIFMIIAIWFVVTATFLIIHNILEDPIERGRKLPSDIKVKVEEKYHLDEPIMKQYQVYLKDLLEGDLGLSLAYKTRTVKSILSDSAVVSFKLGGLSIILGMILGIVLGTIIGLNDKGFFHYFFIGVTVILISVPGFIFAYILQRLFGVKLKWLPSAGYNGVKYMILPIISLAIGYVSIFVKYLRKAIANALDSDYAVYAKAKGLSRWEVIINHVIRNVTIPTVKLIGPTVASSIVGVLIIENIFVIPGFGKVLSQGVAHYDYTTVLSITLIISITVIIGYFISDILYIMVDPRAKINK